MPADTSAPTVPWWKELSRYHIFVFVVAALGWLFDTMDQQLFNLARGPAMAELGGPNSPQFAGGLANLNYLIHLDGKPAVLRRPPLGELPAGAYDMSREFRILSRLPDAA